MMKLAILLLFTTLTSCAQIGALGIEEGENAIGCGRISTNGITGIFSGNLDGITAEVSSNTDTSAWTAEDWALLLEQCD